MGDLIVDILIESTIAFEHDLGELTSEVTVAVMESVNNYVGFPQVKITLPTIDYSVCPYDRS
jgi:hypothetical protein